MRNLRELSKLPTDPEYWQRLEGRVRGGWADGQMGGHGWLAPFARNAAALGGLAVAAGVAALLLVPPRARPDSNPAVLFRRPNDPAMAAFVSASTPPPLATLLAALPRSAP